jgi:hypothetical protein
MIMRKTIVVASMILLTACDKKGSDPTPPIPTVETFAIKDLRVNGNAGNAHSNLNIDPIIRVSFTAPVNRSTVPAAITLYEENTSSQSLQFNYESSDSIIVIKPVSPLKYLTGYSLQISTSLRTVKGTVLQAGQTVEIITKIDSSSKFPLISDEALMDTIQRRTFNYFWDFGHPTSGLARERNTSGDLVTSGGSGFGIMSIIVADKRGFITHTAALERVQKMVTFLKDKAQKFHGAFPHWLNGNTGVVIPFSTKDDGADLVETSLLMQGLLCARQYFNAGSIAEANLRSDINALWNGVEWSWFRRNNEDILYWHWSPNYGWEINLPIRGWNECLITYVLAASSTTHSIPKTVYDKGWANNGAIKNGNIYYGVTLPLGPPQGGPLFLSHYSFMGINPNGLVDAYANYADQTKAHSQINYNYCVANPKGFYGYSSSVWGLTASDDINGYAAHSPTNDNGVISPTAALSSMPYTPVQSMQALKFFYYTLGDKLWKAYGFIDAFSLHHRWFANSFLAIDQGPIIVMIENYRSGLMWNLFMSCPEIKTGMKALGFTSPHL